MLGYKDGINMLILMEIMSKNKTGLFCKSSELPPFRREIPWYCWTFQHQLNANEGFN